jgi:hypothetical protein
MRAIRATAMPVTLYPAYFQYSTPVLLHTSVSFVTATRPVGQFVFLE